MLEFVNENFIGLICFQMNDNKLPQGGFEQYFRCKSATKLTTIALVPTFLRS